MEITGGGCNEDMVFTEQGYLISVQIWVLLFLFDFLSSLYQLDFYASGAGGFK